MIGTRWKNKNGFVTFIIDKEYSKRLLDAALRIAREKVLIASYDIAMHPPHADMVEKRETNEFQYIVYRARNSAN